MKFLMMVMFASMVLAIVLLTVFTRALLVELTLVRQAGGERLLRRSASARKR